MFRRTPSVALLAAPNSLSSAMSFKFRSFQVTTSFPSWSGLYLAAKPVASCCMYRPTLNLRAVMPLPDTSKATPNRGAQFLQFGRFSIASNERAGTKRPAGAVWAGTDPRIASNRMPGFSVTRLSVHESCRNTPTR